MGIKSKILGSFVIISGLIQPALATNYDDPTWPCQQRKVVDLSLGIMWPYPIQEQKINETLDPATKELVTKLSLRRFSLENIEPLVDAYAKQHSEITTEELGIIFKEIFNRLAFDRKQIIDGIAEYSLHQAALSKKIDTNRTEFDELEKASEPDFDKLDELEAKIEWDERIYKERAQSLTYVCETPVIIEKRLFAISRSLQAHASKK